MTEPRTLSDAFDRATDGIEPPGLAGVALAGARRRRARRRGVGAALVSSVAVVAVVVATQVGGGQVGVAPPVGPGTPTPTASPAPEEKVWPEWDPREADELPGAPNGVAPALPAVIEPPATSPSLSQSPVAAAVLVATGTDGVVQVLGTDGGWRTVESDESSARFALSPGGTRLVVWDYSAREHVTVHDLEDGRSHVVPYPGGYVLRDDSAWRWLDEDQLLLLDPVQGWVVDATDGSARRTDIGSTYPFGMAVDPDGEVIETSAYEVGPPGSIFDWAGGVRREAGVGVIGRFEYLKAGRETLAGTSYSWQDGRGYSAVVADRRTLRPVASLPIKDDVDGNYGAGHLRVLGVRDDGVVLLDVGTPGQGPGFRIVAWDSSTGGLWLVSFFKADRSVVFAEGLLRARVPAGAPSVEPVPMPVVDVEPQPRWDPARVAQLPVRDVALPEDLTPSENQGPLGPKALAVNIRDDGLWLVNNEETWVRMDYPTEGPVVAAALSPDGTRVAFVNAEGLWWRFIEAGPPWSRLDLPSGFQSRSEYGIQLDFVGSDRWLLQEVSRSWVLGGSGATELPFDGGDDEVVPAGDGVLANRFAGINDRSVDLWRDGEVTTLADPSLLGATQSLASDGRSMVTTVTTGVAGSSALLALDLDTSTSRAYLPVRDPGNRYTDGGGLNPVGWLDGDTVLLEVTQLGPPLIWLVTWDVRSGDLARVASYPFGQQVAYAVDALEKP